MTTHEVREIEHILTDVVFIHRGRACLTLEMEQLREQFVKLTCKPAMRDKVTAGMNVEADTPPLAIGPFGAFQRQEVNLLPRAPCLTCTEQACQAACPSG